MLKGSFRQQQKARRRRGDREDWDLTAARVAGSMAWRQAGSAGRGFILKPAWARTKLRPFVFHTGPLAALGAG